MDKKRWVVALAAVTVTALLAAGCSGDTTTEAEPAQPPSVPKVADDAGLPETGCTLVAFNAQIGPAQFDRTVCFDPESDRITFEGAESLPMEIDFLGVMVTETWTLSMDLQRNDVGAFEGTFDIASSVDMSKFQSELVRVMQETGWIKRASFPEWFTSWQAQDPVLANEGTFTILGSASGTGVLVPVGTEMRFTPDVAQSATAIEGSDMTVSIWFQAPPDGNSAYADYTLTVSGTKIAVDVTKWGTEVTGDIGAGGGHEVRDVLDGTAFKLKPLISTEWRFTIPPQ